MDVYIYVCIYKSTYTSFDPHKTRITSSNYIYIYVYKVNKTERSQFSPTLALNKCMFSAFSPLHFQQVLDTIEVHSEFLCSFLQVSPIDGLGENSTVRYGTCPYCSWVNQRT